MKKKAKKHNRKRKWLIALVILAILGTAPFAISAFVVSSAKPNIIAIVDSREGKISLEAAAELEAKDADCILVLGAGLLPDGTPNFMLRDRLDVGIVLYEAGAAPKILLSGDHGQMRYDEVNAMKNYVLERGIPEEDVFLDHAGFSTYDSMYRARDVFAARRVIVVTQEYHQYRALYLGERMGLSVWGVCSDQATYYGQEMRDLREIAARDKDFLTSVLKPKPKYLGEVIPISGSGLVTHD